jgi:hypothetical protein
MSGANAEALSSYEQAIAELQCYRNDPVATVQAALDAAPSLVMGHVLHGYLHLLGTEPAGFPVAAADLEVAERLPANAREGAHRRALRHLCQSEWRAAGRVLEDIAIEHPRDVLALQVGHLAVCHLDLEEVDEVLALFDGPIYGQRSPLVLDLIDASALLWRLHLKGVALGDRWQAVADAWEPVASAGNYGSG